MSAPHEAEWATHPAIDLVTAKVAVAVQRERVLRFATWTADALRACAATGRTLQVITGPASRLTVPLRSVLSGTGSRWVVRHEDGHYDGLSGLVLRWDGTAFVPAVGAGGTTAYAEPFGRTPEVAVGPQLTFIFRVRSSDAAATVAAGAAECLFAELTGAAPGGWGTCEPAGRPWRPGDLSAVCRAGAPEPAWSVFVGGGRRPAIGIMSVSAVLSGWEASVAVSVGYRSDEEAPYGRLPDVVSRLVSSRPIVDLLVQQGMGPLDLTSVPHWVAQPFPVGFAVGPEGVRSVGPDRVLNAQVMGARLIGDPDGPVAWYPLHDGPAEEAWRRLERLLSHLGGR